mmetsp:Transcript_50763/g.146425  ORF Transcript_50763/g.146425 Transcript_50763/m.146425 type:complete len:388 (+) Transcript_50763:132-1295(+)
MMDIASGRGPDVPQEGRVPRVPAEIAALADLRTSGDLDFCDSMRSMDRTGPWLGERMRDIMSKAIASPSPVPPVPSPASVVAAGREPPPVPPVGLPGPRGDSEASGSGASSADSRCGSIAQQQVPAPGLRRRSRLSSDVSSREMPSVPPLDFRPVCFGIQGEYLGDVPGFEGDGFHNYGGGAHQGLSYHEASQWRPYDAMTLLVLAREEAAAAAALAEREASEKAAAALARPKGTQGDEPRRRKGGGALAEAARGTFAKSRGVPQGATCAGSPLAGARRRGAGVASKPQPPRVVAHIHVHCHQHYHVHPSRSLTSLAPPALLEEDSGAAPGLVDTPLAVTSDRREKRSLLFVKPNFADAAARRDAAREPPADVAGSSSLRLASPATV